jgi:hypothetical protein
MSTPFKMKGWSPFTKKSEKIYIPDSYNEGDVLGDKEFERLFHEKTKKYPQFSVQDYSHVRSDDKGKYISKLGDDEYED